LRGTQSHQLSFLAQPQRRRTAPRRDDGDEAKVSWADRNRIRMKY